MLSTILSPAQLLACEGPLPIEYETQHLQIGTALDHSLCAGDLAGYEQVIQTTESELGLAMREGAKVYVWDIEGWFEDGINHCRTDHDIGGCAYRNTNTIYTSVGSLEHELVHLVLRNPQIDDFFNEGLAELYSGTQTRFGSSLPSSNAGTSARTMDWLTAAHFLRWVRERWGSEKLRQLVRTRGSTFAAFEEVYGMSVRAADQLYMSEAPAGYAPLAGCDHPELPLDGPGSRWHAAITVDCEQEDTFGGQVGLWTRRSLVIEQAGTYALSTDGAWLAMAGCSEGAIATMEPRSELFERDVPPDYASYPSTALRWFEGNTIHSVHLDPGRYTVSIGSEGFDPAELNVAVWPAAAVPVSPR